MDQEKVSRCVDSVCEKGCTAVNSAIQMLEKDSPVPEADTLNDEEKQRLLQELKSIMAVYEDQQP